MAFNTLRAFALVVAVTAFGNVTTAHADMWAVGQIQMQGINTAIQNTLTTHVSNLQLEEAAKHDKSQTAATPKAAPLTFGFTPSQTRRKANYAAFVAKTRAQDPAGAAQLEQLFAQVDVVAATEAPLAKLGLSSRNVADAYAAWWVTAWLGAQGRSDDPSRGQMQAVKRQAEAAFAATPQVATMTDAQKQEFAEALLVQAALLTDAVEQSQANPAQLEQVKAAIRRGAQASGMDLDAMILTVEGFKQTG